MPLPPATTSAPLAVTTTEPAGIPLPRLVVVRVSGACARVTIGAAAGAGLGLIIGLVGGAYKPLEPDPPYADAVVRCLIEKGYEVSGWQ